MMMNSENAEVLISTPSFPISKGVRGRYIRKSTGRFELALVLDETLTAEELRKGWGAIDEARNRLHRFQGSDMSRLPNALIRNYAEMKASGWSYNLIAMDINFDVLVNLCRAADEISDLDAEKLVSQNLHNAASLLDVMRMKDADILDTLIESLRTIKSGLAPWPLEGGPIDGQRVRDALRQWEQEIKTEKVIVKSLPKTELVPAESLADKVAPETQRAMNLLNSSFPDSLLKYDKLYEEVRKTTDFLGNFHVGI